MAVNQLLLRPLEQVVSHLTDQSRPRKGRGKARRSEEFLRAWLDVHDTGNLNEVILWSSMGGTHRAYSCLAPWVEVWEKRIGGRLRR